MMVQSQLIDLKKKHFIVSVILKRKVSSPLLNPPSKHTLIVQSPFSPYDQYEIQCFSHETWNIFQLSTSKGDTIPLNPICK